jgi:hypothetical protein
MTTQTELRELRTKIRIRVSDIWERLWEGDGRLVGRKVARWRRAMILIAAKERADHEKARPERG